MLAILEPLGQIGNLLPCISHVIESSPINVDGTYMKIIWI